MYGSDRRCSFFQTGEKGFDVSDLWRSRATPSTDKKRDAAISSFKRWRRGGGRPSPGHTQPSADDDGSLLKFLALVSACGRLHRGAERLQEVAVAGIGGRDLITGTTPPRLRMAVMISRNVLHGAGTATSRCSVGCVRQAGAEGAEGHVGGGQCVPVPADTPLSRSLSRTFWLPVTQITNLFEHALAVPRWVISRSVAVCVTTPQDETKRRYLGGVVCVCVCSGVKLASPWVTVK